MSRSKISVFGRYVGIWCGGIKINKTILVWFGGKSYLTQHILPLPQHITYIDVFGGGGSILFEKEPSKNEIYNDINSRLVNFWKYCKEFPDDLINECKRIGDIDSKVLFDEYKEVGYDDLNDAARFLYINRHSFSGNNIRFHGLRSNNYCKTHPSSHKYYLKLLDTIYDISNRLKDVTILNLDFRELINKSNESNTLLYLDPPYLIGGNNYEQMIGGHKWTSKDLSDLLDLCKSFKGKIIFSFDKPILYNNWYIKEIIRNNRANGHGNRSKVSEYISYNFDPSTNNL